MFNFYNEIGSIFLVTMYVKCIACASVSLVVDIKLHHNEENNYGKYHHISPLLSCFAWHLPARICHSMHLLELDVFDIACVFCNLACNYSFHS